jgi:DNA-binding FadR family transcriptional regulator
MVAAQLRSRIVNGELRDGELLPNQNQLLREFPVGRPSIREAMRILETEGLISVRRGNVGGAEVHAPSPDSAAFLLGLVMQSLQVTVNDLATALQLIEPHCAELCATRPDRASEVVPVLRLINKEMVEARDLMEFSHVTAHFHAAIVELCGNNTIQLVMRAFEALWATQMLQSVESAYAERSTHEKDIRAAMGRIHERITDLIEEGDADAAGKLMFRHLEEGQSYVLDTHGERRITVTESPRTRGGAR